MVNKDILVSVSITTFNHEKYIEQCIRSVVEQKVNFLFEIVIGNDASTDNTLNLCLQLKEEFPSIIRIINHEKNIGLRENNKAVWTSCKGKYIAYLEGDDYWIDENKLQKLVSFLEENKSYSAAYHKTKIGYTNPTFDRYMPNENDEKDLDFDKNLSNWEVGTCSFVFRNFLIMEELKDLKNSFLSSKEFWSDRPLMAFVSSFGPYKYFPDCMGVWRQHETNMTKIGNLANMYAYGGMAYKKMFSIFPHKKKQLSLQVIRWYLKAAEVEFSNKKIISFMNYSFKALMGIKSILGLKNFLHAWFYIIIKKEIYV